MILRVWRAKIAPGRDEGYRRFERERCLPMLRRQPGLLGVLFLREDRAASVTIWEDGGAVEALQSSPSYRATTRELAESGLLAGEQSVEAFEVVGGDLRPEALAAALARTRRSGSSRSPAAGPRDSSRSDHSLDHNPVRFEEGPEGSSEKPR